MRILYIASSSEWNGSSSALFQLIRKIMQYVEVGIVLPSSKGPLVNRLKEINVRIFISNYGLTAYSSHKNPIKWAIKTFEMIIRREYARYDIKKIIKTFKPDIVHTNVGPLDIAVDYCIKEGIPHIWHHREYLDHINIRFFPSNQRFKKLTHKEGNYNIAISKGIFDYQKFRVGIDTVISDGVFSLSNIPQLYIGKREHIILFVGRVEEAKGLLQLIKAYAIFVKKFPDYYLYVIGPYSSSSIYYQECVNTINRNGIKNKISFEGHKDNVFHYMQRAMFTVIPSKSEGFGFVSVEAMLNGCLVIGNNIEGLKDQFTQGAKLAGGIIALTFNSTEELVDKMYLAANNEYIDIRERAYNVVKDLYSIDRNYIDIYNYYLQVIRYGKQSI